jgi:hemin uptake protein HemP
VFDNTNENRYHSHMLPARPQSGKETSQGHDLRSADPVPSRDLLGQRGELIIEHEGRQYRLRRTQNGKLILTA